MAATSPWTIGTEVKSKCHKTTYNKEIGRINFDVFSEREKLLPTLKTQIKKYQIYVIPTNKFISSDMQCRKENVQIHSNYISNHIKVWLN